MNLSIVRKSVMPLMAAGLLATGVSACNNNQQKEIMEDAREAVEYTKKFGKDGATILAYYDVYDVNALDSVQKEVDAKTEQAFWDFEANENNTRWDSVYFSNMIDDRKETQKAIEYLKAKAAEPAPTEMELDKAYSRLKNRQEKKVTAKEQDSIAKINIDEYKSELTQKKLLELLKALNSANSNLLSISTSINEINATSEKIAGPTILSSDSAYLKILMDEINNKEIQKAEN